ncbi:MAG: polysaccharide biosynthesis protein PslG [Thermoleophilaceae bacterium]|nr:polysaccharide biosynthesis protein PslG [Thermoleophilaceae bacterium]
MAGMQRLLTLTVAAVILLGSVPAAEAARREVPRAFYAMMWDRAATQAPDAEQDAQWALMARSGVEAVRTVFLWEKAQPNPGEPPDFTDTDRLVRMATQHNIKLLPVVRQTPIWAARQPYVLGAPPARPSDYTAYLQALVGRYGPAGSFWGEHPELPLHPLREWQIWNEPHLTVWWNTEGSWPREYVHLLKASKAAIEDVDPGATVVLASLADFAWKHLARLNRFNVGRYFDVAGLNFFTARPANVLRGVRKFRRALRAGGAGRKPIWLTETTWPAARGHVTRPEAAWQRAWYTSDTGMARRLRAIYSVAARERRALGLKRLYWYTWASSYSETDLFDYGGLVRYSGTSYEPRPALAAYAASARRHQGCAKTSAGVCRR